MEVCLRQPEQVVLDVWPHPITAEGRHDLVVEDGENLHSIFRNEIPVSHDAIAMVNGRRYSRLEWRRVEVRSGDIVKVRRMAAGGGDGSNPLAVVLSIALLVAAPFIAGIIAPTVASALGITSAAGLFGIQAGLTALIGTVGLLVINAIFPPRLPKRVSSEQPARQYTLSGGGNRARPYEPLQWVLGTHRVFPDIVAQTYTEFDEDGEQYLNEIFDYGLGDELTFGTEVVGKTPLVDYEGVETQRDVRFVTLVKGNVDTLAGGNLGYKAGETHEIIRRTEENTTRIGWDVIGLHYEGANDGSITGHDLEFELAYRKVGQANWTTLRRAMVPPDGAEARRPIRRSYYASVASGSYDVRARPLASEIYAEDADLDRIQVQLELVNIRAFQDDSADFRGRNPLALRIRASGQLSGRLEQVSNIVTNGSNNCADVLLRYLQGYRIDGLLVAGMGLAETRIDLESIDAWRTFCTKENLTCNLVLEDGRGHDEVLQVITQCGWGSIDRQTNKWGVIWEDAGRPMSGLITPENVVAGSVTVAYQHDGLADEVTGVFLDETNDYQPTPIRRNVPGVTLPERPVEIELEGITRGEQAAKEVNRTVAAQHFHPRVVTWEMDLDEGMAYARGDVVGAAHGLLGAGSGGRFTAISEDRQIVTCTLDPQVDDTPIENGTIWVHDLRDNVLRRTFQRLGEGRIRLDQALPDLTGKDTDDPTAYRYAAFSDAADLELVRITGKEFANGRVRFTARDEVQGYYGHRTSDLTWDPVTGRGTGDAEIGGDILSITRNLETGIVTICYKNGTKEYFPIEDGRVGEDGSSNEWIYIATETLVRPATPVGEQTPDFVPDGWNDDPVDGNFVWVSKRRKPAGIGTEYGPFSRPAPFKGRDGSEITSIETQDDRSIVIKYSTGNTVTIPPAIDGEDGTPGVGITRVERDLTNGLVTVTYTDGTTDTFVIKDGTPGANGSGREWIYRATSTNVRPSTPGSQNRNDYVPAGWSDDPVSGTYVWVSQRSKAIGLNTAWGAFSTPVPFRGPKGDKGDVGPPGPGSTVDPNVWYSEIRLQDGAHATATRRTRRSRSGSRIATMGTFLFDIRFLEDNPAAPGKRATVQTNYADLNYNVGGDATSSFIEEAWWQERGFPT